MVSIILSSYKRPGLLRLGLSSIVRYKPSFPFEIVVVNDGIRDETESVCNEFKGKLDVKHIFSGQRNLDGVMKHRVSGFALNIGMKHSIGDIIILSCPEIYHLNNATEILVTTLINNPKGMVIPSYLYFDQSNIETTRLLNLKGEELINPNIDTSLLVGGGFGACHVEMPYLMAMYRKEIFDIGAYDEDFTGYAGEDNDLIERLKLNGLNHIRTEAKAIHLYHGGTGDGGYHWENPRWVHNWTLLQSRKGQIIRNIGREWGEIDEEPDIRQNNETMH